MRGGNVETTTCWDNGKLRITVSVTKKNSMSSTLHVHESNADRKSIKRPEKKFTLVTRHQLLLVMGTGSLSLSLFFFSVSSHLSVRSRPPEKPDSSGPPSSSCCWSTKNYQEVPSCIIYTPQKFRSNFKGREHKPLVKKKIYKNKCILSFLFITNQLIWYALSQLNEILKELIRFSWNSYDGRR